MARPWKHMFVVYRFDGEFSDDRRGVDPNVVVSIKEVVDTEEEAVREVKRLAILNAGKGCRYFFQSAKYYPSGPKSESEG